MLLKSDFTSLRNSFRENCSGKELMLSQKSVHVTCKATKLLKDILRGPERMKSLFVEKECTVSSSAVMTSVST
ncbi:unnamed protein product [Musa acuminata subsp. burmannicoides]